MTWYAVYRVSDGELISTTETEPVGLDVSLAYKSVGETRPTGVWNTTTLVFDPPPAVRRMDKIEWFDRWDTAGALVGLKNFLAYDEAAGNGQVIAFKQIVIAVPEIELDNPLISAGMARLVTETIITQQQSDDILADV